jgi:outer membrane protein
MRKKLLFPLVLFALVSAGAWAQESQQGRSSGKTWGPAPEQPFDLTPYSIWYGNSTRFHFELSRWDGPSSPSYSMTEDGTAVEAGAEGSEDKGEGEKKYAEQDWGIGAEFRVASIPFDTDGDTVTTLIPQIFYEHERFYIRGLEAGIKVARWNNWHFNTIARMRFFDIPKKYQNEVQEDTVDLGLQARYKPENMLFLELEMLCDDDFRWHSNARSGLEMEHGSLTWRTFANIGFHTSRYNDYYYGLKMEGVSSDTNFSLGMEAKFHVISNFYLIGSVKRTWMGNEVRDVSFIEEDFVDEIRFGILMSNHAKKKRMEDLGITPYLRLAHGWATPSNLGNIIHGNTENDKYNNQLTSLFYGYPLTNELFGIPLDIYLTPGFVWHWDSRVQSNSQEYVLAVKAYYTIKWPTTWRLGFAEGASYVSEVTYIERVDLDKDDYEASKLMNYLDFSLDLNLGDLFGSKDMKKWWLGYSIHHRSSIFEKASHFGRIKGGSNYNTVYLQMDF